MPAMGKEHFSGIEGLFKRLVESALGSLAGDEELTLELARQLVRSLEDSQKEGVAPTYYEVTLHPAAFKAIQKRDPEFKTRLVQNLGGLARRANLSQLCPPQVELVVDETLPRRRVTVVASHEKRQGDTTNVIERADESPVEQLRLLDAFLIVNGKRHVALDKPLVTIGRRMDNDVIIDSSAVSRRHAHIRWRYGRFILYDVGSRGGISVNGEPCRECVLRPGDLISLSGRVPLIYGEGRDETDDGLRSGGEQAQDTLAFPGHEA